MEAVAVDTAGNVFLADTGNHRVRRIDAQTGIVTSVAGSGNPDIGESGQLATTSGLNSPRSLAFDAAGNLYIADFKILKVDAKTGVLTKVVGGGYGFCGDGGPAIDGCFYLILGVALDSAGNMYISDGVANRVRRVDAVTGIITTIAGNGVDGFSGDGGPATSAALSLPAGLAVDNIRQVLYFADLNNQRVRRVDLITGRISTVAGGAPYSDSRGNGGPAANANLDSPTDVKLDASGNLYIAEKARVRRVEITTGIITTAAGTDLGGFGGDGGPANAASLSSEVYGIALDAAGNVFIADFGNSRVRRVDILTGAISTIAGTGAPSEIFDNGPATAATLRDPTGVVKDKSGNLYITDSGNNRIRRVDAASGIIRTIAGGGSPESGNGDGGPATSAVLGHPQGRVSFDSSGNMFFADSDSVRRVDAVTGVITTVFSEASASVSTVIVDESEDLYIGDRNTRKIFKVIASTGQLIHIAGDGQPSTVIGADGPAIQSSLSDNMNLWLDASENLIVVDERGRGRGQGNQYDDGNHQDRCRRRRNL